MNQNILLFLYQDSLFPRFMSETAKMYLLFRTWNAVFCVTDYSHLRTIDWLWLTLSNANSIESSTGWMKKIEWCIALFDYRWVENNLISPKSIPLLQECSQSTKLTPSTFRSNLKSSRFKKRCIAIRWQHFDHDARPINNKSHKLWGIHFKRFEGPDWSNSKNWSPLTKFAKHCQT